MNIQPLSDWILVKFEPLEKRSSLIELPGQNESAVRKGVVKIVGPGRRLPNSERRAPMDVEVGDKIVFLRWHQEHRPGKQISETLRRKSEELGEDLCLIRQSDILFKYTGDVNVDI
jgi:co-chaperonin GroES (HSP10)